MNLAAVFAIIDFAHSGRRALVWRTHPVLLRFPIVIGSPRRIA
jgi:hypothetical protein